MEVKSNQIVVGQVVSTILYNRGRGVVVAIRGDQRPESIRHLLGGAVAAGGNAYFDIVFSNGVMSKSLPECILRGVQWEILDEVVDADAVAAAQAKAVLFAAAKAAADEAEKREKAAADVAARAAGVKLGLVPEAEFKGRGSAAASNLRAELKQAGIKARVKQDGSAISVILAYPLDAVPAKVIARKYKAGSFDGMTDCYEYDSSAWGRVFGDVQYVFVKTEEGYLV